MKLLIAMLMLGVLAAVGQNGSKPKPPTYNPEAEAVYKGTIMDLRDREGPVSGGIGSHILMELDGKEIEVHLGTGTVSLTKMLEMNLKKGDAIEVTGWKTEWEGLPTILAREIRDGNEVFVFRSKDGTPAGMP